MNKLILPTLIITLAMTPFSWAKPSHHAKSRWAKVTNVEPIMRTIEHRVPHKECWNEKVRYRESNHHDRSLTGTVLGGIVGGAIGNKIGHNRTNKKIGTVVGAVLGASVGHDLSSQRHSRSRGRTTYSSERHCEVRHEVTYEEQVVGYNVWYRYQHNEYKTRMDHRPGKKIKIRVDVQPY